jgi:hypothetical protein
LEAHGSKFFGLSSFPRKESFGGLPEFQSSLVLLLVCLGFLLSLSESWEKAQTNTLLVDKIHGGCEFTFVN